MSSIVVEGRLISPTQIELVSPVVVTDPAVEVQIRPRQLPSREATAALLKRMMERPSRGRTQEDILRQIADERAGWEHRR